MILNNMTLKSIMLKFSTEYNLFNPTSQFHKPYISWVVFESISLTTVKIINLCSLCEFVPQAESLCIGLITDKEIPNSHQITHMEKLAFTDSIFR